MGIKKQDLRDFIDKKTKSRREAIEVPARELIKAAVEPIVMEKYSHWAQAEREAQRLIETVESIRPSNDYNISHALDMINRYILEKRSKDVRNYVSYVFSNLLCNATNGLPKYLTEIELKLKEQLSAQIAEYKALTKLNDELQTLIDSCRNGDMAYKRLESLGVDLTGFKAPNPNLPAIIKLSVDVCVLNGNCEGGIA